MFNFVNEKLIIKKTIIAYALNWGVVYELDI